MLTVRDRRRKRQPDPPPPWRSTGLLASTPEDDLCEQAPKPLVWLDRNDDNVYRLLGPATFSYCNSGKGT
jgi:hypothetical protein